MDRRQFLQATLAAGGGLLLQWRASAQEAGTHVLGPWVRIAPDGAVTLVASQAEIGQGISTTLPAILADEMGADWSRVRVVPASFDPAYRNPRINWMFTGNSESVQAFHDLMRKTGAAAREMLCAVAARRWDVPATECRAADGRVTHASGRSAGFGELAEEAARLPVPERPVLRPDAELRLVGRSVPRVDVPAKVDGSAVFGIDFTLPGLLHAAVRTAPGIGATLRGFDDAQARQRPGVKAVLRLPNGVAVVAERYWQAKAALAAVKLDIDPGPNAKLDSAALRKTALEKLAGGPFVTVVPGPDVRAAPADRRRLVRRYENPFLAHATLEPMNCTARVTATDCEVWAPTQGQELALHALAGALKLPLDRIRVHRTPFAGGGFGRRLIPDFVVQAALIARAAGAPVKAIWDREEDQRRDFFRPATVVDLAAQVQADGMPAAVHAAVVSPTILRPVFPPIEKVLKERRIDPSALEGFMESPYAFPERRVDFHLLEIPVPTSVLRTTGYGPNVFALESFIDELAVAARADPYRYRRALLARDPRAVAVLDRAAALAGWEQRLPRGRGRGIAYTHAFGSRQAQVIEVAVARGRVKVRRIVTVVDCGRTLDPRIGASAIEGGAIFGLAGCKAEVTFSGGAVVEDNFSRYALPTLAEAPSFTTEFIDGGGALGGLGEVGPVTVAPALANAIHAATGRRLRSMPLSRHKLSFA